MAKTAIRRHRRYYKGLRRIKIDRMQHGTPFHSYAGNVTISCECFAPEADRGRGKIFSRFADTPHPERDPWKYWEPLPWEKKAPRAAEWDEDMPDESGLWWQDQTPNNC